MTRIQEVNFKIISIGIIIVFTGLCLRLFQLQIIKGKELLERSEKNIIRRTYIKAPRGIIYDRNGKILTNNKPSFLVTITPAKLINREKTFRILEKSLSISQKEIEDKIKFSPYPTFASVEIKHNLDIQTVSELSEELSELPGVSIETEPVRNYPEGNLASHMLGYVGLVTEDELLKAKDQNYQPWETIGKEGIELYYNSFLRGKQGIREIEIDAQGKLIKILGETLPIRGNNLYTSIDRDLQKFCEEELELILKRFPDRQGNTKAGSVIILSAKTGEVLSICSKPDFNPNMFSTGISEKDYQNIIKNKWHPLFNRSISGLYPPASTFKMVTAAAALEENLTGQWTPFYCSGFLKIEDKIFNCDLRTGHGKIDFTNAIAESCDVVFYELGMKLNLNKIEDYAKEFNIGKISEIDLPGESQGLLPSNEWKKKNIGEEWYIGDTVNLSIGQGYLLATPLQMAVATMILANGGTFYPIHLLKRIESEHGDIIYKYKPKNIHKINVSEKNLDIIKNGMRLAVTKGTSIAANIREVKIAGKTGTAENLISPENPNGDNHNWFVAFAPLNDPEIVVTIFIEQCGGYAGKSAVPLGTEIIKHYFELKFNKLKEKNV